MSSLTTRVRASARSNCSVCPILERSLCGRLDPDARADLFRISALVELPAHHVLIEQGQSPGYAFHVVRGAAKCAKVLPDGRTHVLGFLMPGDLTGITGGKPASCTVETLRPSAVCRYPLPRMADLCRKHPSLERCLLQRAGAMLDAAQERMVLLGRRSARERLACFLMARVEHDERAGGPPGEAWLPARQQDIADHLGLTAETVCRVWSQFRREGVVAHGGDSRVIVTDRDALLAHTCA